MAVTVITQEELDSFKVDLLYAIELLLENKGSISSKRWLKTPEIIEKLGISQSKLQKLRNEGTFPYTKVSGMVFYDYEGILKVFEKNKMKSIL